MGGLKCAPVQGRSFTHAGQAAASGVAWGRRRGRPARVGDGEGDGAARPVGEVDVGGGVGAGVLEGVGEGFLDDAVEGELAALGECGLALDGLADGQPGPADAVEEAVEVGEGRLGSQFGSRGGAVLGVVAQDVQEAAEFAEGLPAGGADGVEGLRGAVGGLGGGVAAAVGETGDDGEVVADDVVHFPCYAGAFGRGGEPDLLVAFRLQAVGAVLQGVGVVAAGADRDADERRHRDGHQLGPDLLLPGGLVAVSDGRDGDRGEDEEGGPGEGAQGQAQGDVEDDEQLEHGGLEDGAAPGVEEGDRGHGEQYRRRVGAAPQERDREAQAQGEQQSAGNVQVVGDVAPAAVEVGAEVDEGGRQPESGQVQVPHEWTAAVEVSDSPGEALDVLGEGFGDSVLRCGPGGVHVVHPTMVGGTGPGGVVPEAVYEVRGVVPGYYGGRHECLGPR